MSYRLLVLSLCIASIFQLTSCQSTSDRTQRDSDVSSCGNREHILSRLMATTSQLNAASSHQTTALGQVMATSSQLDASMSQLTAAVSQLSSNISQIQTSMSLLHNDVADLKIGNRLVDGNCLPILVQQNKGSLRFNRSWEEYKNGFNDTQGNYWVGNELLHQLSSTGRYKLRFDLQSRSNGQWYWAEYNTFLVFSEDHNYRLDVGGFAGNTGKDAMAYHNAMMFTTYDRDNDESSSNCVLQNRYGGFWYKDCSQSRVTSWGTSFDWTGLAGGEELRTSRMWLVCH